MSGLKAQLVELERGILLQTLLDTGVNASQTAKKLEIHRNTLRSRARACDLDIKQLRKNWNTASQVGERIATLREAARVL